MLFSDMPYVRPDLDFLREKIDEHTEELKNAKTFDEAGDLAGYLSQGRSVVLTLECIPMESARRLLDFLSGISFALQGKITPISAKTYFVTPQNVDILGAPSFIAGNDDSSAY